MDDEYDLLRDAAALMDEFGAFGLDFHDAQAAGAGGLSSPTDTGFIRASTAPLPVPPVGIARRTRSPTSGEPHGPTSESDDGSYKSDGSSDHLSKAAAPRSSAKARRTAKRTSPQLRPAAAPLVAQPPVASGKNPSRERLKAELAFLRDHVGDLEKELSDLRFTHEQVATAHAKTTAIAPVWRRIAERQLERRRTAETENERLKNMLDAQIRVAKSLEQMLRKRSSAAMIDLYEGARATRKRCRLDENLETLYGHFMGDIEDAYKSVDQVFATNGLGETFDETVRGYTVKTRTWGGAEQVFIELMDVKIVPFDFARAAEAVWRMTMKEYMAQRRTVETFEGSEDRFAVRYQAQSRSHDYVGLLDVTMVMRRFLEGDRMVLVWRATNAPAEETDYEQWRNVYTEETGWIMVKRVPDDHTGPGQQTAVMQSCVHLIPRWYGSDSPTRVPTKINTGDFAKLVMNAYEEDVIAITEAVENMLLDEAVGVPSGGDAAAVR